MDAPPVQYVTTSDGYRIAYCVSGEGRPLLFISPNFHDTQQVWRFFPGWMEGLAARFHLIQYDPRGTGMSTRNLPESLTPADYIRDLEAVVERLQVPRLLLWAIGGETHVAIRYAAQHPERVDALILNGPAVSGQSWSPVLFRLLPNEDWQTFLRTMTQPGLAAGARLAQAREYQRTVTLEDWNTRMRYIVGSNVEQDLRRLSMPTLVMHPRDSILPPAECMDVAAMIRNGRFVLLDGEWLSDTAVQGLQAIDSFLKELLPVQPQGEFTVSGEATKGILSDREIEVLRLVAAGRSNQQVADELVISLNTVRRHVSNIFDKTGATNRVEAATYARDQGLA